MEIFTRCLCIGAAGFVGAVSRYLIWLGFREVFHRDFPFGTLFINLSGTFLLGWFLSGIGARMVESENLRLSIAVGFIGTYTTFSTFMFESNLLLKHELQWLAIANLVGSVALGLLAVRAGIWVGAR